MKAKVCSVGIEINRKDKNPLVLSFLKNIYYSINSIFISPCCISGKKFCAAFFNSGKLSKLYL